MIKRIFFILFIITSTFNLYSQLYFSEVSDFQKFNHTYINVISGAGVSFVDFNQDGFDDISIPTNDDNSILFFIPDESKPLFIFLSILSDPDSIPNFKQSQLISSNFFNNS